MTDYDVVIIGGGCAGLAAALYAKRYEMNVVVYAAEPGGLITTTHIVENYPGVLPASGWDMMNLFLEQMKQLDVKIEQKTVTKIDQMPDKSFEICVDGECVTSKTVIYATGTKHRHLNAPGEEEYKNKGVSYCATCDGPLFRGANMAIVGGGDSAAKEALLLSDFGKHIYILARSTLKAEPINASRIKEKENITVIEQCTIEEIHGDGEKVTGIQLACDYHGSDMLEVEAVFIAIGHIPQTDLINDLGVDLTERGEIKIDRTSRTNIPGFYAAGDCTDAVWKQAIISSAEGSQAANSAYEDITSKVVEPK